MVSALWDKLKAQCPKGKESLLAWPSPEDIEKLVCKLASSELVEKEAAEEVCKLIKEHFPAVRYSQTAKQWRVPCGIRSRPNVQR